MDSKESKIHLTQGEIAAAIQLWNLAAVSLLDIRHHLISPAEPLRGYRLPASTFVYIAGKGEVSLNHTIYSMERFGLFHGGKGTELSLYPVDDWLEYYMVLYKAEEPSSHKKEYGKLLEQGNPFRQQYGFAPCNPLFFAEQLRRMYEKWSGPTPLNLFYGKSAFYQLVYEVYEELNKGNVRIFEPDMIALAQKYLDEHYHEVVSIQTMREQLGISNSHFHRLFTARTGKSPQEYLIGRRLDATKQYLADTDCTLREIAAKCGFSDELSLMRMFRKHVRMSTTEYRDICVSRKGDLSIDNVQSFPYNEQGQVRLDQLKGKGATFMLKQIRSKAIVAAALSLLLLMSACSTAPATNAGANATVSSTLSATVSETKPGLEGTRTIRTPMGEVEVSANPKRIVVNGWWVGDVVAFGVTPVAIQGLYATGNGYESKTEGVKRLEKWEAEDIMSEEPDLIITGYERNYEDLSKIAPTVFVPYDMPDEERLPLIAQALGKEAAEGTALLDAFQERVEKAKARLQAAGVLDKTITVCRNGADAGLEIQWSTWWGGSIVYDKFGMPMPAAFEEIKTKNPTMFSDVFSYEVLPQYIGDYILMNNSGEAENKKLQESPIWNAIPAVKNGKIIEIDAAVLFFTDISSQNAQLDLITDALLQLA